MPARTSALLAAVAVAAGLGWTGWLAFGRSGPSGFDDCTGSATAASIGGPFELVNTAGQTVTDKDVIDQPALIYFGYTFCPDVCPLDVARNVAAVELLEQQGIMVKPVFISIDPARDTPEQLDAFAQNMHPRMEALGGTEEQVAAASKAYRTYYAKRDGDDPEFYLVDHSTQSYFVLPGHGFVDFFRNDQSPELMAERMACFIEAA